MSVVVSGPLFEGATVEGVIEAALRDITDDVALDYGVTVVQELQRVVRNPTPYYWTKIEVERRGNDAVINDSGVVYGPWLAGISRRNVTTRFKGYQHWRRATERVRRRIPGIAVRVLRRHLPRAGGG